MALCGHLTANEVLGGLLVELIRDLEHAGVVRVCAIVAAEGHLHLELALVRGESEARPKEPLHT